MITAPTITGRAGDVLWYADYYPFGEIMKEIGSIAIGDPATTGFYWQPPFRFPGQYEDEETGLFYNWNRYYMPEIGRYNRLDPAQSTSVCHDNLYIYSQNNPIAFGDITGLYTKDLHYAFTNYWDTCTNGVLAEENVETDRRDFLFHDCAIHWPTEEAWRSLLDKPVDVCNIEEYGQALHMMQDYHAHILKINKITGENYTSADCVTLQRLHGQNQWIDEYHDPKHPNTWSIDNQAFEVLTKKYVEKFCDALK